MRRDIIVLAAACLATAAIVSTNGCSGSGTACAVADLNGRGSGYQTPENALRSILKAEPRLPTAGWKLTGRSTYGASFVSGDDSVDIVKNKGGKWVVGGYTVCG